MNNTNKGRILIVDDNPKNIQVLGNILNDNQYTVEIALGGKEALEWLKDEQFDLLLLDIMMPEINGFEVCKNVRSNSDLDLMPIIFLSAKTDKDSTVQGFNLGGQDYITKPFDIPELLARVSTHIDLKKSKEEVVKTNNVLEEKVNQRTNELRVSNEKLLSITLKKDLFLSFIGKEISKPLHSIHKAVNLIKSLAESQRLSEMISLLEDSLENLEVITNMANQIIKINNGDELDFSEFQLESVVEHILIHKDDIIEKKEIELTQIIAQSAKITGNKDLIKNSIEGITNLILKHINHNKSIHIEIVNNNNHCELIIKSNLSCNVNDDSKNIPEETSLLFTYTNLVMNFHDGNFIFNQNKDESCIFKWTFPYKYN